jgi:hypothetical protein
MMLTERSVLSSWTVDLGSTYSDIQYLDYSFRRGLSACALLLSLHGK